ncbi:hypothetical protein JW977_00435 [Candidatus Falkowbacteria bacterium]|nr:hypothetical protein [Candidatus Falkowbacteria bacterium]
MKDKKFVLFTILILTLAMTLFAQNIAQAGSVTAITITLEDGSGNNISDDTTAVDTTTVAFDPATSVNTNDGILISFASDFDISSVVNGDVAVTQANGGTDITKGTAAVSSQDLQIPVTTEGDTPGGAITVTITNSHITTPTSPGTYTIRIRTYDLGDDNAFGGSGADADTLEDDGAGAVVIGTNEVIITGTVDPTLTLAIVELGGDTPTTACALGTITPTNIETCGYRTKVSTNANGGYNAYIKVDGSLTSGSHNITDVVAADDIDAGTEEYGVSSTDTDADIIENTSGHTCTELDHQSSYAMPADPLTTNDQTVRQTSAPANAEYTTICHAIGISGTTSAGYYTQTATITVVGSF